MPIPIEKMMPEPPRPLEELGPEEILAYLAGQPKWAALGEPFLRAVARRLRGDAFASFYLHFQVLDLKLHEAVQRYADPDDALTASGLLLTGRGGNYFGAWREPGTALIRAVENLQSEGETFFAPTSFGRLEMDESTMRCLSECAKRAFIAAAAVDPYLLEAHLCLAAALIKADGNREGARRVLDRGLEALRELRERGDLSAELRERREFYDLPPFQAAIEEVRCLLGEP